MIVILIINKLDANLLQTHDHSIVANMMLEDFYIISITENCGFIQ